MSKKTQRILVMALAVVLALMLIVPTVVTIFSGM